MHASHFFPMAAAPQSQNQSSKPACYNYLFSAFYCSKMYILFASDIFIWLLFFFSFVLLLFNDAATDKQQETTTKNRSKIIEVELCTVQCNRNCMQQRDKPRVLTIFIDTRFVYVVAVVVIVVVVCVLYFFFFKSSFNLKSQNFRSRLFFHRYFRNRLLCCGCRRAVRQFCGYAIIVAQSMVRLWLMGHRPAATVKPMRQEDLGQQYNIIYILFRIYYITDYIDQLCPIGHRTRMSVWALARRKFTKN